MGALVAAHQVTRAIGIENLALCQQITAFCRFSAEICGYSPTLQLRFLFSSESMSHHDSGDHG
jgi:hypothetical protein